MGIVLPGCGKQPPVAPAAAARVEPKSRGTSAAQPRLPGPQPGQPWENSLGMKFVPVPGTNVLFGIWETRVQDFSVFVHATNYDAGDRGKNIWKEKE